MAFDWIAFFISHRVPYSESGANTSRDNVVVHCPFCGPKDPSQHMSVNLSAKGWRCFRDNSHRGKNPARLVAGLTSMSIDRANALVGNAVFIPEDFIGRVHDMLEPEEEVDERPGLAMPPEFKPFNSLPSCRPYVRYLEGRGFTHGQIDKMTARYGMRYCTRGSFQGRIIFPVRYKDKLVSWTGRTIVADHDLRYRALGRDPERTRREGYEPALGAISHYLLWFNYLSRVDADTIVLVEGPFDALKINVLGRREGVCATCFFTSQPTELQMGMLRELIPRFRRRVVMLDQSGTFATGIRITNALSALGVTTYELPHTLKDPGEFGVSTFADFLFALR